MVTDGPRQDPDLFAYRAMVIEEFYDGEISAQEMRLLVEQDPELETMFHDRIEMDSRLEAEAGMRLIAYAFVAAILCIIAGLIVWTRLL